MIFFFVLYFLLGNVYSRDIWDPSKIGDGPYYRNITLTENEPLILPVQGNLTIYELKGTLGSNSLSQLNVTDLYLLYSSVDNVESGALCSTPTLTKLKFDVNKNFRITKEMLKNCDKLEELSLRGTSSMNTIDSDVFENLPNLKNLILHSFEIENLTQSFFEKASSLENLTLESCSIKHIETNAFEGLKNLKEFEIIEVDQLRDNPEIIFNSKINTEKLTVIGINSSLSAKLLSHLNVSELQLHFKFLDGIEPGSICSSSSLKRFKLTFHGNDKIKITKDGFQNCEKLEKLTIWGDYEKKVEQDVFENLPNMIDLTLGAVTINHLTRNHLKNLPLLEVLKLHDVELQKIEEDSFNDLKHLKVLRISNNNLGSIPEKLFEKTPNLEDVFIAGNQIRVITWDEFKGLSSLKKLNIAYNHISNFNVEKIVQHMPNLNYFNFARNNVNCEELETTFIKELGAKLNHAIDVVCIDNTHGEMFAFDF